MSPKKLFLGLILLNGAGLVAFFVCSRSPGQEKPAAWQPPRTEFECRFTELPIKIDGKGNDAAWKHAQTIDNFYLPWLGKNARPAKTKTSAKLLWDREYLYFFADMEDTDLYADVTEHDGQLWDNDVFELFFKPADNKPGYYEFQVNAAGAILDMFLPRRGAGGYQRYKKDRDFHIEAKVHLRGTLNNWTDKDEGWSVEGKIPWKDFLPTGGRPEVGEKWKFALCRYDYSVDFEGPELSTCAPLHTKPTPDFHAFEGYATLKFVRPEKSVKPFGIDKRIPLTTSKVIGSPDPPLPFKVVRAFPDFKISFPIAVVNQPGSDRLLFVYQQGSYGPTEIGRIKGDHKATAKDIETLLKLSDTAYDIVFHPKFAANGYFYIGSNGSLNGGPKKTRVTRYTMERTEPYKVDPKSATVIIEWDSDGHNGGAMAFGHDGMFYVTSGDGTSDSDTNIVGQDMTKLLAKVLRIDIDHPEAGEPGASATGVPVKPRSYSIPKDNPFVNMKDARPEIWALGLRNPWRMTLDKKTGHLWVGQNGQDLWEQAYLVKKAENYGWSITEGSHPFYPNRKPGPLPLVKPTIEHHHSEFRSLTGGIVYYGNKFPELEGAYIYGDYSTGRIWAMKHDGTKPLWHKELCDSRLQITGFGVDAAGEILICDHRRDLGGFYTLSATPKDTGPSTFPKKLSESGLLRAVKGHVMEPALIPYSVNSVLWSDGAFKQSWLGIPGDGKIDFTTSRGWNFPDETVIVKSFGLELEEG
ncbi:MAG: PQQ-dependent sugar dehydrogenase [Planctomycetes bacterium]|nr:PQQ-dependent sugar dehydrogenase [Planctomycetota bacterium]